MLIAFGIVVLLFVAYQLWGTSITTQLHQDALRTQLERELAALNAEHHVTTTTTPSVATTTTTTQPIRGVAALVPGIAPAEGQPIGTIVIPKISANYVFVQGTNTADLELGPGHYENTPLPGQPGNAAIAGHRTTYLHPFYNLNELSTGDPIYVTTAQGRFQYNVSSVQVVDPSDVAVLNPTAVPTLTLTTCNPRFSAAQRLIVQAVLVTPPAPIPVPPKTNTHARIAGEDFKAARNRGSSVWPAVGLGAASVAVALGAWALERRVRRWYARFAVTTVGILGLLIVLFFFFENVSPFLPSTF